jgi:hypothetical protein
MYKHDPVPLLQYCIGHFNTYSVCKPTLKIL